METSKTIRDKSYFNNNTFLKSVRKFPPEFINIYNIRAVFLTLTLHLQENV